jgi:hypothetical protein
MANPLLPIAIHNSVDSTYVKIKPSDRVIVNFETSRGHTISSISSTITKGQADHNIVTAPNDSVCAFTASWSGSNSSYWLNTRMLLKNEGWGNSFTATTGLNTDIGVFALRKKMFDIGVVEGGLTATATGVTYDATSIAGDYYDSGSGALIQKSSGNTVGIVIPDSGMFVVTSSTVREVATSVTSVSFKSRVMHTNLNVFCKCQSNELNFTFNPTAVMTGSLTSSSIVESFDNLLTKSNLTADTGNHKYWSDLVSSGHKFSPVISHVGLYNDSNELMAVAKLAAPLKKPTDLPITVRVSVDL